jgi:hypothetical protein
MNLAPRLPAHNGNRWSGFVSVADVERVYQSQFALGRIDERDLLGVDRRGGDRGHRTIGGQDRPAADPALAVRRDEGSPLLAWFAGQLEQPLHG